jgi:RimJ/RimL family protein N-acetyltransferase
MSLLIERTFNADLVKRVLTLPEMWRTIAEDGVEPEDFEPDMNGELWLAIWDDMEIIGVFNLHSWTRTNAQIHAHVIPNHRKKYSKKAGGVALRYIYDKYPMINKINAVIPVIYRNVRNFTEGFGFRLEGVNKLSYTKGGNVIDQWYMGITRDEIGVYLSGQGI